MADKPPMCPGTWLFGNAKFLLADTAGTLTRAYEHEGPMFRIRAAWRQYTVIAGPEASEFMAQGLDKVHLSRERLFGSIAKEFGPCDLVLKEIGPKHARLRSPLAVAYSRQVASPHVPAMVDAVRQHVRCWPVGTARRTASSSPTAPTRWSRRRGPSPPPGSRPRPSCSPAR